MFILLAQFGSSSPTPDYDEIASVLRGRGYQVWVATRADPDDLEVHDGTRTVARLRKPSVPAGRFFSLPGLNWLSRLAREWVFAMRLRRFIQKTSPDVAQLNRAKLIFFWAVPLWAKGRTRYILDWRQIGERSYRGPMGRIKATIALHFRRIPSRYIYDRACFLHAAGARQILGEQWQRWATIVPLAVSVRFLQYKHDDLKTRRDDSTVRFIYIGTLNRVRHLERIILAAQEMQSTSDIGKGFEIVLIGPDKTDGYYQEMVDQLDLKSIVRILPPVPYEDVPGTVAQYDVALAYVPEYPLDWQYHPTLKVFEYRALGMPIIATDFEPNREVVQDEVNGLLVSNSAENIAHAMRRFVCEKEFLRQSAENAKAMRWGLLWQDISEMYEQLYQRLLEGQD